VKGGVMSNKISESIWSSDNVTIPMADVQHIEKHKHGLQVIMKSCRWNFEHDCWDNNAFVPQDKAESFMSAWCYYRGELEGIIGVVKEE
jgi:hypothetical protein